jgi:hypothetical protein
LFLVFIFIVYIFDTDAVPNLISMCIPGLSSGQLEHLPASIKINKSGANSIIFLKRGIEDRDRTPVSHRILINIYERI